MSTAAPESSVHSHDHDPHLAHHFDTPEQQFATGKLGMWIFLATEILMFGGLFCAYAVYRHNHPDIFAVGHRALNPLWGGINTIVLITSSLTMAWGVRAAQLGQARLLAVLLTLTLLGGFGFMGIKAIEYRDKWEHHLGLGTSNVFRPDYTGAGAGSESATQPATSPASKPATSDSNSAAPAPAATGPSAPSLPAFVPADPNAGTPNAALIRPRTAGPAGLAQATVTQHRHSMAHLDQLHDEAAKLNQLDRDRMYTFFGVYFAMTGLHGIHVLVGMTLIFWILKRSVSPATRKWLVPAGLALVGLFFVYLGAVLPSPTSMTIGLVVAALGALGMVLGKLSRRPVPAVEGEFGPRYFLPVDLVGLYWHLVDLIWIFLFPLLYLIH